MVRAEADADLERRIRERAASLWIEAGRPRGRDEFLEKARELIAVEDNQELATRQPPHSQRAAHDQPVESPRAVENLGEFPGLSDQGEQSVAPERPSRRRNG